MSSQGPNGLSGFTFNYGEIRDAADYTAFVRQQRIYAAYRSATAPPAPPRSVIEGNKPFVWGTGFRTQYLLGRHKNRACSNPIAVGCNFNGELGDQ
jgi:hypothetical protein